MSANADQFAIISAGSRGWWIEACGVKNIGAHIVSRASVATWVHVAVSSRASLIANSTGTLRKFANCRNEDSGQNADDGDDDHQFNEGESLLLLLHVSLL